MEGQLKTLDADAALGDTPAPRRLLHVGCGDAALPGWLGTFAEVRLDISPRFNPHIVADMLDMGDIGEFDVIYNCHSLEHLYPHQVPLALAEFMRVLKPNGILIVFVPDVEDVRPTEEILIDSPAGPVAGLDILYGFRPMLKEHPYMAHHTAFTAKTLGAALLAAGYAQVSTKRLVHYNLFGTGLKR